MFSGRIRRVPAAVFGLVVLALVGALEQARLVWSLLSRYTNEDHAILWLAASDWMHLKPHEPTFYGQPYGVNLEAIPIGLLKFAGVSYGTGLPVALLGMALVVWWLLAWVAARRDMWLAALVAAAAPILLNTDHWVIVGVIGTGVGRLLAASAIAVVLWRPQNMVTVFLAVALGGYAVAIDTAAVVIAAPALVYGMFDWFKVRRFWAAVLIGSLAPLAWKLSVAWFENIHPDHALHGGYNLDPSFEPLQANYENLSRLFGAHSFELVPYGQVFLVSCAIFLVLSIASLRVRAILAVVCYIALQVTLLSLPKSLDGSSSLWFPHARMTIAAPIGLWFIGAVSVHAFATRWWSERSWLLAGRFATIAVVAMTAVTSLARARDWKQRIGAIESVGLDRNHMPLHDVNEVYTLCERASDEAVRAGTRIVLFPHNRTANYACAALQRRLLTACPDYERRYWVLRSLSSRDSDRMIVWGLPAKECWKNKRFRAAGLKGCTAVGNDEALLLEYDRGPALDLWRKLGNRIRPFGPGCHPASREGCDWWAGRYDS